MKNRRRDNLFAIISLRRVTQNEALSNWFTCSVLSYFVDTIYEHILEKEKETLSLLEEKVFG